MSDNLDLRQIKQRVDERVEGRKRSYGWGLFGFNLFFFLINTVFSLLILSRIDNLGLVLLDDGAAILGVLALMWGGWLTALVWHASSITGLSGRRDARFRQQIMRQEMGQLAYAQLARAAAGDAHEMGDPDDDDNANDEYRKNRLSKPKRGDYPDQAVELGDDGELVAVRPQAATQATQG